MEGPQITDTDFNERRGTVAVETAVLDARCVWRETLLRDVGIDGQIEYVLPSGVATGRIVAVQVKSGSSFWDSEANGLVPFTPKPKHRAYWSRHPIPVILVLHHPGTKKTIYVDVRPQLRDGANTIKVPTANTFDTSGVHRALAADGPLPQARRSPDVLLREMVAARHPNPGFRLSFFDLFVGGLTDLAKSLYFGMDLASETQDVLAALPGGNGMISIGAAEYEFIDRYISYLIGHDLARVDFDAWRRMADRFAMTGTWIAPLTAAGEELTKYIQANFSDLTLVRERPVSMMFLDIDARVDAQLEVEQRLTKQNAGN